MAIINFTRSAIPVSDFEAEAFCQKCLEQISRNVNTEVVRVCNVLVWNMLRAELVRSPLKSRVVWQVENIDIDMNSSLISKDFWYLPASSLNDEALEKLLVFHLETESVKRLESKDQ